MTDPIQRSVSAPLSGINLMGDLCLILPSPLEYSGPIFIPECSRPKSEQLLHGVVVKCGPGDRMVDTCEACDGSGFMGDHRISHCKFCGGVGRLEFRRYMHVKPGDRVLYWRSPANQVVVGGVQYEILHEEQMIVAVLED